MGQVFYDHARSQSATYNRRSIRGILAFFATFPAGRRRAKFTMPRNSWPKALAALPTTFLNELISMIGFR
jgi:hypothetical protein